MLVRLLLVVLMLVGSVPTRECTCAATVPDSVERNAPRTAPVVGTKSCGCIHRAARGNGEQVSTDHRTHTCGVPHEPTDRSTPVKHDHECPVVQPRAVIADAVVTSGPDLSLDVDFSPIVALEVLVSVEPDLFTAKIKVSAPSVPLFIALLNLRN